MGSLSNKIFKRIFQYFFSNTWSYLTTYFKIMAIHYNIIQIGWNEFISSFVSVLLNHTLFLPEKSMKRLNRRKINNNLLSYALNCNGSLVPKCSQNDWQNFGRKLCFNCELWIIFHEVRSIEYEEDESI